MSQMMKMVSASSALACAVEAAQTAGKLMRENLRSVKKVNAATMHDIKLELDVRCQKRIAQRLRRAFPKVAILGEEGVSGDPESPQRWVVDPIDGTVNFSYGIPHACVSIALQVQDSHPPERPLASPRTRPSPRNGCSYHTVVGVVYDPFCDELWTAVRGQRARLNGRFIQASRRRSLRESIVSLGFAKNKATIQEMLPALNGLLHRVRKIRIMGSAALALVYVASGRMDAYVEYGLRLWDIAAGGLMIECAGGEFWHQPVAGRETYQIIAHNGLLRRQLEMACRPEK
jgi:myo-inositol-1(or 4)-monophosphatase